MYAKTNISIFFILLFKYLTTEYYFNEFLNHYRCFKTWRISSFDYGGWDIYRPSDYFALYLYRLKQICHTRILGYFKYNSTTNIYIFLNCGVIEYKNTSHTCNQKVKIIWTQKDAFLIILSKKKYKNEANKSRF